MKIFRTQVIFIFPRIVIQSTIISSIPQRFTVIYQKSDTARLHLFFIYTPRNGFVFFWLIHKNATFIFSSPDITKLVFCKIIYGSPIYALFFRDFLPFCFSFNYLFPWCIFYSFKRITNVQCRIFAKKIGIRISRIYYFSIFFFIIKKQNPFLKFCIQQYFTTYSFPKVHITKGKITLCNFIFIYKC